jgi:hypothetical protein
MVHSNQLKEYIMTTEDIKQAKLDRMKTLVKRYALWYHVNQTDFGTYETSKKSMNVIMQEILELA